MATSPEKLANTTAEGFIEVNAEIIALRAVAMQNHIALDVLLAAQGGTCAIIGTECYTYIPDNSEQIDDLSAQIKAEGAKYHDHGWEFGSWLKGIFGDMVAKTLQFLFFGLSQTAFPFYLFMLSLCYASEFLLQTHATFNVLLLIGSVLFECIYTASIHHVNCIQN